MDSLVVPSLEALTDEEIETRLHEINTERSFVVAEALRRGAVPRANERAERALRELLPLKEDLTVLCAGGEMGESLCRKLGFTAKVVHTVEGESRAEDTIAAARAMNDADIILFAGGDGTARNIVTALGSDRTVLGIPAGVKIHSPVYAVRPEAAGALALGFLRSSCAQTREAEVVDIDEDAYREGRVNSAEAAKKGVSCAPGLTSAVGNAIALGKLIELLIDVLDVDRLALEVCIHDLAEILLYLLLDYKGKVTEAGSHCIENRVIYNDVSVVVNLIYLLQSAVAATHSGSHYHKLGIFHNNLLRNNCFLFSL
jgi:predicted polyphosphate/ATP-dependent NAD kinase